MPQARNAGSDAFQEAPSAGIWLPGGIPGRLGRFTSAGSLCDQSGGSLLTGVASADLMAAGVRLLIYGSGES